MEEKKKRRNIKGNGFTMDVIVFFDANINKGGK
jgi:hypothetical protein